MASFHLHLDQGRGLYFFKLFAISLPVFCLLTWFSFTVTNGSPPPPPPRSALFTSRSLKTSGYSIIATLIAAIANTSIWNGTGTVLAPPDFAFSSTVAQLNDNRRCHSPSASLLLHHTLQETLNWHDLSTLSHGHQLLTWHPNRCVFLSKGSKANLAISNSPRQQHSSPIAAIKIRRPDLYVDDHLTVHGVDGVLDPTSSSTCSFPDRRAHVQSQIDQSFLDHAVRALKRSGFSVVATAMAIKHSILVRQKEVTVFAPADASLFPYSDGFRFDFLRHVVTKRIRLADIASVEGTEIETLSPNKSVVIRSLNRDVTVNGVAVRSSEVYRNRWIIVFAVSRSIEGDDYEDAISRRSEEDASEWRISHEVSPAAWKGGISSLTLAVEGEDLLCPATSRSLRESGVGSGVYVERSPPSTSYDEFAIKLVKSGPSRGFNRGL